MLANTLQDNAQYWVDRHKQRRGEIAAVGDIRKSEQENITLYAYKKRYVFEALRALNLTDLAGKNVLDAGCGIGLLSEMLWILGANVSGVDVSREAVELAKTRAPDGNFKQDILSAFSFDQKFDLIICIDVLYHIIAEDAWKAALNTFKRHMLPGGYCIIMEQLKPEALSPAPHVYFRTRKIYLEATEAIGFKLLNLPSIHSTLLVFQG